MMSTLWGDDSLREVCEVLWSVDGWPKNEPTDLEFLRRMKALYRTIDLMEEAVGWSAWMSEHEQKKKVKHRARFRNWLRIADERQRGRSVGRQHRRAEQEGHGDAPSASRDW